MNFTHDKNFEANIPKNEKVLFPKETCLKAFSKRFSAIKTVIINRAVPGSGKSSLSQAISFAVQNAGLSIQTHSTDDFFMRDGRYCFDAQRLSVYHARNLAAFCESLRCGINVVVCDNTNLVPWQTAPYTDCARKYGYQVIFLNLSPRELWKHRQAQLVTTEKPDAHNVPTYKLAAFIQDFNTYNELLDPACSMDLELPHFDYDVVINIAPAEYQMAKQNIGKRFLELLNVA